MLKDTLLGNREKALREMKLGPIGYLFISSDLTAATDRISHELAIALWEGFAQSGLLTVREIELIRYCLGP